VTFTVNEMPTRPLGNIAATISIAVALLLGTATNAAAGNGQEVCGELDSGKIDTTNDPQMVTMTAPVGSVIVRYCVKAGSDTSVPDGPVVYIDLTSEANAITVGHPSGKAVSHYSFEYEPVTTTTDPSVDEPPVDEPPVDEPPVDEPPVDETPADSPPADSPPVDDSEADGPTVLLAETDTAPTATQAPAPPAIQELPVTGSQTWIAFYLAIITLATGLVITRLSRRPEAG
jgi:hypothetical protein